MFFSKNTKCKAYCSNRQTEYGVDRDGYNTTTYIFYLDILEPEKLKGKTLTLYSRKHNDLNVDTNYTISYNNEDGSFKVLA